MGKEFTVDTLEDLCSLMCDNFIPGHIKVEVTEDINGQKYVRMTDETEDKNNE